MTNNNNKGTTTSTSHSSTTVSQLALDMRQLTVDMRRTLADEEQLLYRLQGGDAWAATRDTRSSRRSRYPPLYIYLDEKKHHRCHHRIINRRNNAETTTEESEIEQDSSDTGDNLSTKNVDGSQQDNNKHNGLSFADFSEMEPSLKLSCIRSMLLRGAVRENSVEEVPADTAGEESSI